MIWCALLNYLSLMKSNMHNLGWPLLVCYTLWTFVLPRSSGHKFCFFVLASLPTSPVAR